MNDYFITFGIGQEHANHYVRITAEHELDARKVMHSKYGDKWAFSYDDIDNIHKLDRNQLEHLKPEENYCPQCFSWIGLKFPQGEDSYCEDCGWPNEDFNNNS